MNGPEIIAWVGSKAPAYWLGRSRRHDLAARRWLAAWLCREARGMTSEEIATRLRLHDSTVRHGQRQVDRLAALNPEIAAELHRVVSMARGNVVSIERARA